MENNTDENGMLDGLAHWASIEYPKAEFVRAKSHCQLVPMFRDNDKSQYVVRKCKLATRVSGSSNLIVTDVFVAGRDSGIIFHLKTPDFDQNDDHACDKAKAEPYTDQS